MNKEMSFESFILYCEKKAGKFYNVRLANTLNDAYNEDTEKYKNYTVGQLNENDLDFIFSDHDGRFISPYYRRHKKTEIVLRDILINDFGMTQFKEVRDLLTKNRKPLRTIKIDGVTYREIRSYTD